MPAQAPVLRTTRAMLFAGVCTALAATGHTAAGHATVSPLSAAAGFAGVLGVAWALTGAERSLAAIAGLLIGGQFALHALFTAGTTGIAPMGPGHHMLPGAGQVPGGSSMTLAHAGAALLSAWWLRRGERLAWMFARRAAALAAGALRPLLGVPSARALPAGALRVPARTTTARQALPGSALLRHSVVRRGPPAPRPALGPGSGR